MLDITRVPGTSSRIAGVVTWRGATIPVMDLHANAEQFRTLASREGRVLLLKRPAKLGILIDRAQGVHAARPADVAPWRLLDAATLFAEERAAS